MSETDARAWWDGLAQTERIARLVVARLSPTWSQFAWTALTQRERARLTELCWRERAANAI